MISTLVAVLAHSDINKTKKTTVRRRDDHSMKNFQLLKYLKLR